MAILPPLLTTPTMVSGMCRVRALRLISRSLSTAAAAMLLRPTRQNTMKMRGQMDCWTLQCSIQQSGNATRRNSRGTGSFWRSVDAKSKVAVCLICHKEAGCKTPQNLNNHLQHWDRKHEGFKAAQARHSKKKEETNPVGP